MLINEIKIGFNNLKMNIRENQLRPIANTTDRDASYALSTFEIIFLNSHKSNNNTIK